MKFTSVHLFMDFNCRRIYQNSFQDMFNYNVNFITTYISSRIKSLKFETCDTFSGIFVKIDNIKVPDIYINNDTRKLTVSFPAFDKVNYLKLDKKGRFEFYLSFLEKSYHMLRSKYKIPFEELLSIHHEFRKNDYKNTTQKNKIFKDLNLEIITNHNTNCFEYYVKIWNIKTKEKLVSGLLFRTLPDPIFFKNLTSKITYNENNITFFDNLGLPTFLLNIDEIKSGIFNPKVLYVNPYCNIFYNSDKNPLRLKYPSEEIK